MTQTRGERFKIVCPGTQGHVSAKTVNSAVEMIEWGIQRLFANLSKFDYKATNLLSCMTLDVENCH